MLYIFQRMHRILYILSYRVHIYILRETIVPADQYFSKNKAKKTTKILSRGKGPVPMHTADDRFLLECI